MPNYHNNYANDGYEDLAITHIHNTSFMLLRISGLQSIGTPVS